MVRMFTSITVIKGGTIWIKNIHDLLRCNNEKERTRFTDWRNKIHL